VGAAKPAFTLEQLADFTPKDIDGAENGVNCRGDVVDGDGKVHGLANLHVAGSAVFPTYGASNPTLNLLALTLRLADHLKRIAA
jgi:choline dehydrogenase-like flavoprotein